MHHMWLICTLILIHKMRRPYAPVVRRFALKIHRLPPAFTAG